MTLNFALLALFILLVNPPVSAQTPLGIFSGSSDVGTVLHRGNATYDATRHTYTVSGSGENIWVSPDEFHFVWKKVSGDFALTADISILTTDGNPHRKAVLMIRQSLDPDSPYADIALHGEGLTSLQFRDDKGAATHEVQLHPRAQAPAPGEACRLRLHGTCREFGRAGGDLEPSVVAGIGVCSHDKRCDHQSRIL